MYYKGFMELAVDIAKIGIANGCGGPFGCVIVDPKGEVLAMAHNTVVSDNDPTAHGEMNAIRMASERLGTFNLEGCELYTTSEPCPMCLGAIMWARISKVYSGMTIEDAEKLGFDDSPFYSNMNQYINNNKSCQLIDMEFHKDSKCTSLFTEYNNMEKELY